MKTGTMIGKLRRLKKAVLADGIVDWDETDRLLEAVRPLAERHGFIFQDYERLLEKCRADGKITPEESRQLALQLDFLCSLFSNLRLKFLLGLAVVLLLLVSAVVVGQRVGESVKTAPVAEMPQQ